MFRAVLLERREPGILGRFLRKASGGRGGGAARFAAGGAGVSPEPRRRGVILELCPTSNVLTKSVSSIEAYPLRQIRAAGVRVCVNADDPGVFDYDLNHEYRLLAELHGQTAADFAAMNRDALAASFLPAEAKSRAFRP